MKATIVAAFARRSATLSLCAAAVAATLPAAQAQSRNAAREQQMEAELQKRFAAADLDHDGRVTRAEAQAGMPLVFQYFDEIDSARNGSLTLAQIAAFARAKAAARKSGG